ncbi:MAG: endonuclease/exonuclease/phosphatase family protein [Kiritimatiellae bacterium]|nr:endonuclease/exonuclease/phosphatase family protein [Kiritimatiellia bacterium]
MNTKKLVVCAAVAFATAVAFAKPVTMMSYNIRIGCGLSDPFKLPPGDLGHLPQVAKVIKEVNPDWVAIQEIDSKTKRVGFVDQTKALAELCGMKGVFVRKTLNTAENRFRTLSSATAEELSGSGAYGLAILSKEEPLKISKVLVPGCYHTRCIEFVEFKDYVVACTHFPLKAEHSLIAAKVALANIADHRKPVFIAGDFNLSPESEAIAELKKGLTILNDTAVPTFPSSGPTCCIDYIMVDTPHADRVSVTERRVIADADASDHCAVVVKAEVRCD